MLIADRDIGGIGLGTAQFAFRDGTAEDSVATVHAARRCAARCQSLLAVPRWFVTRRFSDTRWKLREPA